MEAVEHKTEHSRSSYSGGTDFGFGLLSPSLISPFILYPLPKTSNSFISAKICFTVILFSVIVPVLSEHMTDAQPSVSTL